MTFWKRFLRRTDGASAVEFAIIAPVVIVSILGVCDVGNALYVRNTFTHAIADTARSVYIDSDLTEADLRERVEAKLGGLGAVTAATVTSETVGGTEYRVISAQMTYTFRTPPVTGQTITLRAQGRAPRLSYN